MQIWDSSIPGHKLKLAENLCFLPHFPHFLSQEISENILNPWDPRNIYMSDDNIPFMKYEFKEISAIANIEENSTGDVMGIVTEIDEVQEMTTQSTGKEVEKREITQLTNLIQVFVQRYGSRTS